MQGMTTAPYTPEHLQEVRNIIAEETETSPDWRDWKPDGQPFYLHLLSQILRTAKDPDAHFPESVADGMPLGVDHQLDPADGIWPYKDEYLDGDTPKPPDIPHTEENYPTEAQFRSEIRQTFMDDVAEDMAEGPYTLAQAAARCLCKPDELVCAPLAGKDEGEKVRSITDGTACGLNPHIQAHIVQKTLVPHIPDLMHALAVLDHITPQAEHPHLLKMDVKNCLLYTSPSPRDLSTSRMPSSA